MKKRSVHLSILQDNKELVYYSTYMMGENLQDYSENIPRVKKSTIAQLVKCRAPDLEAIGLNQAIGAMLCPLARYFILVL